MVTDLEKEVNCDCLQCPLLRNRGMLALHVIILHNENINITKLEAKQDLHDKPRVCIPV